ncbi:DUF4132 domain-containing protein [Streptomyces nigrescens]|uniref:DUF4132 domain-containing protein n=1 Tax=Streptomyces nigrescens TaxID=1920 RepID=A0ABY7JD04_STRNI|nr:DUF4132 domain-containing protein [Streptomyces nigrescens]WAU09119.1 DUF4132 domain-containing protein [Streptomyces nigrescens]
MDELSPHAAQLRAAMAGPQPDADWSGGIWSACARLTPEELGALLPAAYRTLADESAPDHARRVAREVTWAKVQPSFTAAALTDLYAALAESPRPTDVRHAAGALLRCTEPWDQEALAEYAALLVRTAGPKADRVADAALAVAVLAGPAVEEELIARLRVLYADSPLRLAELEVMLATGPRERAMLAEDQRYGPQAGDWPPLPERDAEPSEALHTELARHALRTAADHLAALHAGQIPYAADKAFTPADTDTLRRAARLALRRDEPWAEEVFATLLPQVAVAPTSAKTLPSQGACIALAQAVEAYPTPEAIAALREARRVVRHAGVSKKLDRLLRRAERRLGRRTEVALRLPDLGYGPDGVRRIPCGSCTAVLTVTDEAALTWEDADGCTVKTLPALVRREYPEEVAFVRDLLAKTRAQVRTLAMALEGGYAEGTVYRYDRWRAALAGHPVARGTARRLVWEVEYAPGAWRAVLPAAGPLDLPEPPPSAAVRLWHPARASSAERRTWRDRIAARQLRQPFRQVYREHYLPEESGHSTTMFRGHLVRIEAVLGLAVRQGWNIEDEELTLSVGEMKARFGIAGNLYPGASGWAEAQDVFLQRADGGPQPLAGVDAVRLSEILRSVDLLISAGSFAWCATHAHDRDTWHTLNRLYDQPLGRTARLRRTALRRVLAEHIASGRLELGDRHLHLDGYDIHLATGRVTREGDPVDIELPTGRCAVPLPFLPYDEPLLERVVHTVSHLLEKGPVPHR